MTPPNKKRKAKAGRGKPLLFSVVAVLLFFAAAEIALRATVPQESLNECLGGFLNPHRDSPSSFVPDDFLFWRLLAPNPGWHVSGQGFRGDPVSRAKADQVFRVICMGDSCTFGLGPDGGVPWDRTYPALLQRLLAERMQQEVQVINAAVPGYSSFQGLRYLSSELTGYQPDMVTAYFGINDSYEAKCFPDSRQRILDDIPSEVSGLQRALRHSRLYMALGWLIRSSGRRGQELRPGAEYLERVDPQTYRHNIAAMKELGRENGFELLPIQALYLDDAGKIHALQEWAAPGDLDWLAPARDLERQGEQVLYPAPDNVHPTAAGHELLAEILADRIAPIKEVQ